MKGRENVSYCPKCKVSIRGEADLCPLCQSKTEGISIDEECSFPKIKNYYSSKFAYKLVGVISIFIVFVALIINVIFKNTGYWSGYVIAGIVSLWLITLTSIKKRDNVLKAVYIGTVIIILLSILWDFATGMNKWSFDFVIPIILTISTISVFVLIRSLKIQPEEYSVYLINLLVLNFLLIASFYFIAVIKLPTIICFGINLIITSVLVIFNGKKIAHDIKRRMHI